MKFRLTDKEIQALAKKLAEKRNLEIAKQFNAKASKKIPEAKKIVATLNALPDCVLGFLYSNRYSRQNVSPSRIAKVLLSNDEDGETTVKEVRGSDLENDVVLAAHGCTSMMAYAKNLVSNQ